MSEFDDWLTDNSENERHEKRCERLDNEFLRKYGAWANPKPHAVLLEAIGKLLDQRDLYDLLVERLEALDLDKQEDFLGVDND